MARILIVDDSGFSRRAMRHILESAGHAVEEAADGLAALERYSLLKPDLVTLDLTMAGMDGFEVLAKLRQLQPTARVLVASADVQSSSKDMAAEAGAAGFLNKPFAAAEVLAAVEAALKQP